MEMPIKEYEYKAPSYEKVQRPYTYVIDEEKEHKTSRFYEKDNCWHSKQNAKDEINLLFAGDLLCQENMIEDYVTKDGKYDFSLCFELIRPLLKNVDFVAGNLETPVSQVAPYRGEILTHEGPFFCNAPIEYLEALKYAGFDMLTTANNHTLDAGAEGLYDTIINARKFGFIQTGTFIEPCDKFVIVDICGFKVGFTAFTTSYNMMQKNLTDQGYATLLNGYYKTREEDILKKMKEKGAEYTICFPHWGEEYTEVITERQQNMADKLTKLGYDVVVGAHSHVIQRFDYVNDKPVSYSLGNLISHINVGKKSLDSRFTVLMNLKLKRNGEKIESEIEFIPCRILRKYKEIPFTVVPVNKNISFGEEFLERLGETEEKARQMLGNGGNLVNTNYPVDAEAMKDFEEFKNSYEDKLSKLKLETINRVLTDIKLPNVKPKGLKRFFVKPDVETLVGKYQKHGKELKLICLDTGNKIVKIETEIEGVPVTVAENYREGNDSTRVLYIGKKVRVIKKQAFSNFSKLESVRFYTATEIIEMEAFSNCEKLTGLIFPSKLKEIQKKAFAGCTNLISVKIPKSVEKISEDAFEGADKLTIYCEEGSYADKYAKANKIPVKYMPL